MTLQLSAKSIYSVRPAIINSAAKSVRLDDEEELGTLLLLPTNYSGKIKANLSLVDKTHPEDNLPAEINGNNVGHFLNNLQDVRLKTDGKPGARIIRIQLLRDDVPDAVLYREVLVEVDDAFDEPVEARVVSRRIALLHFEAATAEFSNQKQQEAKLAEIGVTFLNDAFSDSVSSQLRLAMERLELAEQTPTLGDKAGIRIAIANELPRLTFGKATVSRRLSELIAEFVEHEKDAENELRHVFENARIELQSQVMSNALTQEAANYLDQAYSAISQKPFLEAVAELFELIQSQTDLGHELVARFAALDRSLNSVIDTNRSIIKRMRINVLHHFHRLAQQHAPRNRIRFPQT